MSARWKSARTRTPETGGLRKGVSRIASWLAPVSLAVFAICVSLGLATVGPAKAGKELAQAHNDEETLSLGGRLYGNHWNEVGRTPPQTANPAYPARMPVPPAATWRCAFCHGWDYRGRNGHLGREARVAGQQNTSAFLDLKRVRGRDASEIVRILKSPSHLAMTTILGTRELEALSFFLSRGQHNLEDFVVTKNAAAPTRSRGKDLYATLCARCHNADGMAFIFGEAGDVPSLAWLARNRPAQVLHKIINGVPKADMLALRQLETSEIASLFSYLRQLDKDAR